ncbi:hypothetical protein HF319_05995 [Xanthomonas sp. Kuri4-1]
MKRMFLLLGALLAAGAASAQANDTSTAATARELDLSVPQEHIQYRSDPTYQADAPGTYYGDKSGRSASAAKAAAEAEAAVAQADSCQGEVHGSVSTGIGYSSRGGNSNYQAANLNLCKTYYNDDGKPRQIGVSISVGQGEGPGYGRGYYGRGGYGAPPFGW